MRLVLFPNVFKKYSRNLLETKYDSTMVTFNSCTDTRQISAAPNFRRYLIVIVPFWKMMSFETIKLRFLVRNRAAFCLICVFPQMQCGRDADETLSFHFIHSIFFYS